MERTGGPGLRKVCMNVKCGTSSSNSWKPGWFLRSGHSCELCEACGLVYDQGRFCETFHSDDAGWRTCNACKKRVHCGCIASVDSFVLLDAGGVECQTCAKIATPGLSAKHLAISAPQRNVDPPPARAWGESFGSRIVRTVEGGRVRQPYSSAFSPPNSRGFSLGRPVPDGEWAAGGTTPEPVTKGILARPEELQSDTKYAAATKESSSAEHPGGYSSDGEQQAAESSPTGISRDAHGTVPDSGEGDYDGDSSLQGGVVVKTPQVVPGMDDDATKLGKVAIESSRLPPGKGLFAMQDLLGPGPGAGLSVSIGTSRKDVNVDYGHHGPLVGSISSPGAGMTGIGGESRDLVAKFAGASIHRSRHRQLLPRPFHPGTPSTPDTNMDLKSNEGGSVRVARPPGQGRGRNQLLPRYWPRITDQELQQITSGDSNATITPLFEKMLSASDAGRIGRLVLPKACAEAYFPAISQPEGLPMKIQDVTGKEWVFQFRFWPNNNSRMYVLEGVTPCIQSMQLQAGDTVTFSRLDPEGKLVMGYRRAPASSTSQDPNTATRGTPPHVSKGLNVGSVDGLYAGTGASLLPVTAKAEARNKSGQSDVSESGYGWFKAEKALGKEGSMLEAFSQVDRKRGRPLGGKSKRLRLDNEDSLELKANWEEAQELLRPPPSVVPSIVTIEGHDFEEYQEPPVSTKRTVFSARQSGEQDQWAQCDECGSWRRVPADGLVTSRWTCSDNAWDPKRASCSAPQELSNDDVEHLMGTVPGEEYAVAERSDGPLAGPAPMLVETVGGGLDALANAAAGETGGRVATSPSSPARTTKHPRHRPGCTCIVCIQPPSGKGPKHKQNCLCNVCVTVKRRFKTLMLRRKKRLSEREAEGFVRRKRKDEVEVSSGSKLITDAGSRHESSGGGTVVEGPRRNDTAVVDANDISGLGSFGLAYSNSKSGENVLVGKGKIDLNSQPEREEEPAKVSAMMSMTQLLQDATLPLDAYLKQRGMKSLFGSSALDASGLLGHEGGCSDKKSDEQSSSQCPDQSNEEASQTSSRARGDSSVVPNQLENRSLQQAREDDGRSAVVAINQLNQLRRSCGTSTAFSRKRTPRVAPSKQVSPTKSFWQSMVNG